MEATLSKRVCQIRALPLPDWEEQASVSRTQSFQDQITERRSIPVGIKDVAETGLGGQHCGRGADGESRAVV